MDFFHDASQFASLSSKYREQVANSMTIEAAKTMREIKQLIDFNVQRLCSAFYIKLFKKATQFDTGKGIIVVSSSINKIISKGMNLQRRDLSTLNPDSFKILDGVNIMLDYSGSMWFPSRDDCIGAGLKRIHAQNFLALVLVEYLRKISRNKLKIVINAFCRESILQKIDGNNDIDYDIFIVHRAWASGAETKESLLPEKLKDVNRSFFLREDLNSAIQESVAMFTKRKMKNFITLFMTDGGLHRIGETGSDRVMYLKNFLAKLQSLCVKTTTMFAFIKEQRHDTAEMCKEAGIDVLTMNNEVEFNKCFEFFTQLINNARS